LFPSRALEAASAKRVTNGDKNLSLFHRGPWSNQRESRSSPHRRPNTFSVDLERFAGATKPPSRAEKRRDRERGIGKAPAAIPSLFHSTRWHSGVSIAAGRNSKSACTAGNRGGGGRRRRRRINARLRNSPIPLDLDLAGIAPPRVGSRAITFFFFPFFSFFFPSRDINSPANISRRNASSCCRDNPEANEQKTRLHSRIDNRMRPQRTEETYEGGEGQKKEGWKRGREERRSCVVFKCWRSAELF